MPEASCGDNGVEERRHTLSRGLWCDVIEEGQIVKNIKDY